jgi:hypothetical protein
MKIIFIFAVNGQQEGENTALPVLREVFPGADQEA